MQGDRTSVLEEITYHYPEESTSCPLARTGRTAVHLDVHLLWQHHSLSGSRKLGVAACRVLLTGGNGGSSSSGTLTERGSAAAQVAALSPLPALTDCRGWQVPVQVRTCFDGPETDRLG